jgi:hypothetical protein
MTPIKFPGCNCTYAKDQPEYLPLPARKTEDSVVTSCWKLRMIERLRVAISGKVYVHVMTFNKPLQPQKVTVKP